MTAPVRARQLDPPPPTPLAGRVPTRGATLAAIGARIVDGWVPRYGDRHGVRGWWWVDASSSLPSECRPTERMGPSEAAMFEARR